MPRKERKKPAKKESDFLCSEKIIISPKEARKLLGKEISEKISDSDLAVMIGSFSKLADSMMNTNAVPKNLLVV